MCLVKAQMAFYHDKVGTRAHNETFEVLDEKLVSELEQAGYVKKVDGEEAEMHQKQQELQKQVGQRNALANEAVSMANHEHNVQANQHTQNVQQAREQIRQHHQRQAEQQNQANHVNMNGQPSQAQNAQAHEVQAKTAKKANDK